MDSERTKRLPMRLFVRTLPTHACPQTTTKKLFRSGERSYLSAPPKRWKTPRLTKQCRLIMQAVRREWY